MQDKTYFSFSINEQVITDPLFAKQINQYTLTDYSSAMVPDLLEFLHAEDPLIKHEGVIGLNKVVLQSLYSPYIGTLISNFMNKTTISELVSSARQSLYPYLKSEAVWLLLNISSRTNQMEFLVDGKTIQLMIDLLYQKNTNIMVDAASTLSNIAMNKPKFRDKVIRLGGLKRIMKLLATVEGYERRTTWIWTLAHVIKVKPMPKNDKIQATIQYLCQPIKNIEAYPQQLIKICIWTLHFVAEKGMLAMIVEERILRSLFQLVRNEYFEDGCLELLVHYSQNFSQLLIEEGIFDLAFGLLFHRQEAKCFYSCWMISNLVLNTEQNGKFLLANVPILERLFKLLKRDSGEIKKEIFRILSNLIFKGEPKRVLQFYIEKDVIEYFEIFLLTERHERFLKQGLTSLKRMVHFADLMRVKGRNLLLQRIKLSSIPSKLHQLKDMRVSQELLEFIMN